MKIHFCIQNILLLTLFCSCDSKIEKSKQILKINSTQRVEILSCNIYKNHQIKTLKANGILIGPIGGRDEIIKDDFNEFDKYCFQVADKVEAERIEIRIIFDQKFKKNGEEVGIVSIYHKGIDGKWHFSN